VTNVKDENKKPLLVKEDSSADYPLLAKHLAIDNCEFMIVIFYLVVLSVQNLCNIDTSD